MAEGKNNVYFFLIIFVIFALFHKALAMIILFNIQPMQIRVVMNILEPIFIFLFLLSSSLNNNVRIMLYLFLLAPINYWLFRKGLIYNVIDNNPVNNKIVNEISFYGDSFINIFIFSFTLYVLYSLFFQK
jgi:hypothetical protein